ncbi:hypothetical protein ACLB2K_077205 [Fragaria x ananassa]
MCPTPSNNLAPSRGTLTVILLHLSSVFLPSTILRESQDGDICVVEVNKWTSIGDFCLATSNEWGDMWCQIECLIPLHYTCDMRKAKMRDISG